MESRLVGSLREPSQDRFARFTIHAGSENISKAECSQGLWIRGLINISSAGSSTRSAARATTIVRPMSTPK